MLLKFFGARTRKPPVPPKPALTRTPVEERSSALKIIHLGGRVESYYMAVPAARIMEKYPSFALARPEVFRRPWDSVVRPEEILTPGQKYFVVPSRTVKKLRRRIKKPTGEISTSSFLSQSSIDVSAEIVSQENDGFCSKSFLQRSGTSTSIISTKVKGKAKARKGRVSFIGVDGKHDNDSVSSDDVKKISVARPSEGKRRVRSAVTWQPSLTMIAESHGADE